jgi:hypothetical protein
MGRPFKWDRKNWVPVWQQVWHDKDPSLLKGPERRVKALMYILQPFTGNADVSIWVKDSRVGRNAVNNQSINQSNLKGYTALHHMTSQSVIFSAKITLLFHSLHQNNVLFSDCEKTCNNCMQRMEWLHSFILASVFHAHIFLKIPE